MFSSSTNYNKLKTNLRLTINRLKLLEKKKTEIGQKARKEIADYISSAKDDRARIRVEHIIREDYIVEAMELLEMYCDLLLARFGLVQTQKELDPGLEEAISSLIWAAPRLQTDVPEMKTIADQLTIKYGKEFGQACRTNALNNVSEKVMHKLGVQAPPKILIERYMIEIAKSYNVPFEADPTVMSQDEIFAAENLLIDLDENRKPGGGAGGGGGGTGILQPYPAQPQPPPPNQGAMYYPPPQQQYPSEGYKSAPPPVPNTPPSGYAGYPPGGASGGLSPSAPAGGQEHSPPPPYTSSHTSPMPSQNNMDSFPDLPAVPNSTLPDPPGASSAGGEDVDFDDLSRRFEELKRKK
ncbi:IST1 homolog [Mya arenaria]|uniref:IST1 homolog n=1 Tax=Mya arenaria TaxID=6604 RepID=UPI0022E7FF4B|nr:IST1 homolog [Mya arenaria]